MSEHFDVVIVGGAVMGSSVAYFLSECDVFTGRVLVLERDPSFEFAASTRSTSGFRQQFSSQINIEISRFSSDFIKHSDGLLAVGGERPGITVWENGYLYLGDQTMAHGFVANNALQTSLGVDARLLGVEDLARRFPWLTLDDVVIGSLGLSGEGWFDGHLLMNGFRRRAQSQGVEYRFCALTDLQPAPSGGFRLELANGGSLMCDQVVNVAGTAAPSIAAMLGLKLPVQSIKQSIFNFTSPFAVERMPYVFAPDGLFCRPEGRGYIAGLGISEPFDPVDPFDMSVEYRLFDDEVWPRLAARASGFNEARFTGGWAGHYDMSLFDHNPFVGAVDALPGYLMATGFSGHGMMQSPAIGRALAELIVYGRYKTLDLGDLALGRLARNQPIVETIQY